MKTWAPIVLLAALAAGCQTQQKPQSTSSVLDVSAPLPRDNNVRPMTGYQPAPGPYAASPTPATTSTPPYMLPSAYPPPEPAPAMTVVEAQPPAAVPAAATAKASGSRYTVKQGDTLYHIAKVRYGNGNQWQRIVSANPGVSPSALKVGQVLVVP